MSQRSLLLRACFGTPGVCLQIRSMGMWIPCSSWWLHNTAGASEPNKVMLRSRDAGNEVIVPRAVPYLCRVSTDNDMYIAIRRSSGASINLSTKYFICRVDKGREGGTELVKGDGRLLLGFLAC